MTGITHGNILAVFFSASEAEIAEGRDWYAQANLVARTLSNRYDLAGPHVAAGIIAALSPNNRWHRNVADAEALIRTYCAGDECDAIKVSTYSKNKEKAIRILDGESPENVLGGLKVRAFYNCIIGGDDVCVDGHAFSIWSGQRVSTTKTPKISPRLYNAISEDYRRAAAVIDQVAGSCYTAAQIQAITWVVWRNQFGGRRK